MPVDAHSRDVDAQVMPELEVPACSAGGVDPNRPMLQRDLDQQSRSHESTHEVGRRKT